MSGRNRNIRLPIHTLTFNHPLPDAEDDDCFGEEIRLDNDNFECDTHSDSLDSILCDVHTDKSSSSTMSWGAGDENETTMILKNELERMEDVLTGQQPIPPDYDSKEYHRWLRYFPRFCIVGIPLKGSPKNHNRCEMIEEMIAVHPEEYQDAAIKDSPLSPDPIKETLIEHVYNKLSKLLINPQSSGESSNLTLNIDDYLKISPSPSTSLLPHRHRYRRGHSSKSLISSQTASAKWLKDDDRNDYASLPFLGDNRLFVRNEPKSILKTRLVLPPIDQFRSISATPRAAISTKYTTNLLAINGEQLDGGTRRSARRKTRRRFSTNKSYKDE